MTRSSGRNTKLSEGALEALEQEYRTLRDRLNSATTALNDVELDCPHSELRKLQQRDVKARAAFETCKQKLLAARGSGKANLVGFYTGSVALDLTGFSTSIRVWIVWC